MAEWVEGMIADWTIGSGPYLIEYVSKAPRPRIALLSLTTFQVHEHEYDRSPVWLGVGLIKLREPTDEELARITAFKLTGVDCYGQT